MATQEAPDASDRAAGPPAPKRQKANNDDLRIKPAGDNSLNVGVANPINHGPVHHGPPLHGGLGPSHPVPQTPQPAPRALTPTNIAARRLLSTPHLNPMAPPFQPQTPDPMAPPSRPQTFVPMDPFRPQHPRIPGPTSSQPQVSFPYPPMLNSLGQVCPQPSQQQASRHQVRSPKFGEEQLGYFTDALHDLAGEITASGFEVPFSVSDDDLHKHSYENTWEQFVRDFKANSAQNTRPLSPSDLPPDMLALFRDKEEYVKKNINASKVYFSVPRVAARARLAAPAPNPAAPGAPINRAIQPAPINSSRQQIAGAPVRPAMQPANVVYSREQTAEGLVNPAIQSASSNNPTPPPADRQQTANVVGAAPKMPAIPAADGAPTNPVAQRASSNGSAHPKNDQQQTPADGSETPKMPPMGYFPTRPAPPPKRKSTKRKALHEAPSGAPDLPSASSANGAHANGPANGHSNRAQPADPVMGGNASMGNPFTRPAGIPAPENPHADFHLGTGFRSNVPSTKTELGLLNTPVDRRISHPSPRPAAAQPAPTTGGARQHLAAATPSAQPTAAARQGAPRPSVAHPPLQPNAGPRQSFMDPLPPHMRPPAGVHHPSAGRPVQTAAGDRPPSAAPAQTPDGVRRPSAHPPAGPHSGPRQPFTGPPPAFHGPPPHPDNLVISRSTLNRTLTALINARRTVETLIAHADAGRDPAVFREQARIVERAIKNVGLAAVDLAQGVRVEEYWPNINLDLLLQ
ncbi:hypothetical protein COL154_007504 [Colletotrichum chrysophilum]|uniref:uncharacterized protein n=1 Tax=Colletotrichum chrysophilum TaxID=1836956 RepID=UPI002300AC52|nr:uncharacterized protein COL26b_007862 [Colletotrichum chrysophilum]KAJ0346762.1 hypothetical protein KNSL1_007202 [Colletotrichum chrysophilum]KAJ0360584.1 hypothetical protein COL154_007504 [Colletotrichum chrysophilum]KAJ0373993.1 hypothetical protein COL26b_007862 [Colletotrichum chrysophilum]